MPAVLRVMAVAIAAAVCFALLLPAMAVAAVLLLVAWVVRAIAAAGERRFVPWTELMAFEPGLGWKARPRLDTSYLAEHDDVFRIVTDEEGWPGRRSLEESAVIAIGDSFAFGYGVDSEKSFAAVDREDRVKAIGAPGYSMVHGVLLMERLATRLRGKLVVWLLYPENDLQDNLVPEMRRYRAPFVRRDESSGMWQIVDAHVTPQRWLCSNLDERRLFARMCVPGPLADRAFAACGYLIERAHTACVRSGARLAVLTIPHPSQLTIAGQAQLALASGCPPSFDAAAPDRRIAVFCERLGVPFTAAMHYLSRDDYKRREGIHWNERGHRRVASLLRQMAVSASAQTAHTVSTAAGHLPGAAVSDLAAGVTRHSSAM